MSLHNDLNNINNEYIRKRTKTEEREAEKIKKQRFKRILVDKMQNEFKNCSNIDDLNKMTALLLHYKNQNIKIILEDYKNTYKKDFYKNDFDYLNEIYLQEINKIKKEYKIILQQEEEEEKESQKMIHKLEQQEEERRQKEILEKQRQKEYTTQLILTICKSIIFVCALPFILLGAFIIGMLKNTK